MLATEKKADDPDAPKEEPTPNEATNANNNNKDKKEEDEEFLRVDFAESKASMYSLLGDLGALTANLSTTNHSGTTPPQPVSPLHFDSTMKSLVKGSAYNRNHPNSSSNGGLKKMRSRGGSLISGTVQPTTATNSVTRSDHKEKDTAAVTPVPPSNTAEPTGEANPDKNKKEGLAQESAPNASYSVETTPLPKKMVDAFRTEVKEASASNNKSRSNSNIVSFAKFNDENNNSISLSHTNMPKSASNNNNNCKDKDNGLFSPELVSFSMGVLHDIIAAHQQNNNNDDDVSNYAAEKDGDTSISMLDSGVFGFEIDMDCYEPLEPSEPEKKNETTTTTSNTNTNNNENTNPTTKKKQIGKGFNRVNSATNLQGASTASLFATDRQKLIPMDDFRKHFTTDAHLCSEEKYFVECASNKRGSAVQYSMEIFRVKEKSTGHYYAAHVLIPPRMTKHEDGEHKRAVHPYFLQQAVVALLTCQCPTVVKVHHVFYNNTFYTSDAREVADTVHRLRPLFKAGDGKKKEEEDALEFIEPALRRRRSRVSVTGNKNTFNKIISKPTTGDDDEEGKTPNAALDGRKVLNVNSLNEFLDYDVPIFIYLTEETLPFDVEPLVTHEPNEETRKKQFDAKFTQHLCLINETLRYYHNEDFNHSVKRTDRQLHLLFGGLLHPHSILTVVQHDKENNNDNNHNHNALRLKGWDCPSWYVTYQNKIEECSPLFVLTNTYPTVASIPELQSSKLLPPVESVTGFNQDSSYVTYLLATEANTTTTTHSALGQLSPAQVKVCFDTSIDLYTLAIWIYYYYYFFGVHAVTNDNSAPTNATGSGGTGTIKKFSRMFRSLGKKSASNETEKESDNNNNNNVLLDPSIIVRPEVLDIMRKLSLPSPSQRLTAEQLSAHPFLRPLQQGSSK
ncbi:hypothetical protein ADEAN_000469600 [Angomonas deanei]|uniref:Protein kinase domain containing protein n=1 Tax=Angomonas deanei TaxID=59799 RepID=A0A7G2CBQ6_9TRYP|nr:hypothetical protein ADEAN_000469600 [Angomonas deanei]